MIYRFLAFLLFANTSYATPKFEIIDIPSEIKCWKISEKYCMDNSTFPAAIDCYIKGGVPTAEQRVIELTPDEARENFFDDVQQKLTPHNLNAEDFFTKKFFGYKDEDDTLLKNHQYIIDHDEHLRSALEELSRPDLATVDMLIHIQQLSLGVLSLSPQQLFEACVGHKKYSQYLNSKNFQDYTQANPVAMEKFFSPQYFGIPADKDLREKHFLQNGIGFFTPELVRDILGVAALIIQNSAKGDDLIIFGNTPYFIGRALEFLISTDESSNNFRRKIDFPFSGTPNTTRDRQLRILDKDFMTNGNIVTSDRLKHFRERLSKTGILDKNHNPSQTIHIVDCVETAGGMSFFIEATLIELMSSVKNQQQNSPDCEKQKNIPQFNVFSFGPSMAIDINIIDEPFDEANPPEKFMLTLPTKYTPHFRVPAHKIFTPHYWNLTMPPNDDWRVFPHAPACFWNNEVDLNKKPSSLVQYVIECFDLNIKKILMKICDDQKLDEKARQELIEHCDKVSKS